MSFKNFATIGDITGLMALGLALLMFFGITAQTVKNLPWKNIGSGATKGAKFTGMLMGIGAIFWFGMLAGLYVIENKSMVFDSISEELGFSLSTEVTMIIFVIALFFSLAFLGFLVNKSGQFLVQRNPFAKQSKNRSK